MNGYLTEKKGKYYIVIRYKDSLGKWTTKWLSTGYSTDEDRSLAENFLKQKITEIETDGIIKKEAACVTKDSNIGFVDYLKLWLNKEMSTERVSKVTLDTYETLCNKHIIPYFETKGNLLVEITTDDLQEFINYEKNNGNRSKKKKAKSRGLSPKTIKHIKNILNIVFKEARRDKLIADNPCEFLVIPKQTKRDVTFFDVSELNEMFEKMKDEELFPLLYVTVFYGLRRSEVLGLKWDSIDFKKKTLSICHTIVKANKIIEKDTTKNDSSYRTFPLAPEIEQILILQKERESENKKKYKSAYNDTGYIFKQECGLPYRPDYITRKFSQLLVKYDMPHIRFHDLRHSCASLLISQGYQLKDVQEWLGHADISTTANIYAHLDQSRKINIMSAMQTISTSK